MTAQLDGAIRGSLTEFFREVCASRWRGREREAVSLYAFGYLLKQCRPGRVLQDPAQIGIEVAVPGAGSTNRKKQVCKDLVIWAVPRTTCWDENGAVTRAPMAILEWKVTRKRQGVKAPCKRDVDWLLRFSSEWRGFTGYVVSLALSQPEVLDVVRVQRGELDEGWLRLGGEQGGGAARPSKTTRSPGPRPPGLKAAVKALESPDCSPDEGAKILPRGRGLYAVHGTRQAWAVLGLMKPEDVRPLYVGKAEQGVQHRLLGTHFSDGRTGRSALRRSLAALLRDQLRLRAIPRNLAKPADFTKFALSAADDQKLSDWMRRGLRLTAWPAPSGTALPSLEAEIVKQLKPPLNLVHVKTPWTAQVKAALKRMADEARRWRPGGQDGRVGDS